MNVKARKEEYKRRQAIVEHPFDELMNSDDNQNEGLGDLQISEPQSGWASKRAWGYTYTLMKTIPKVET